MGGMEKVVNKIGGVKVNSPLTFDLTQTQPMLLVAMCTALLRIKYLFT